MMDKKAIRIKKGLFVFLVALLILLFLNVSLRINPFDGGGCISIAFDKFPMLIANRAVICYGDVRYEITDIGLVREITSETRCATNTDLRHPNTDRWIEIYCGDTLIRRMRWEDNHDGIIVYNAGVLHWIFPSNDGEGLVYPSEELLARLNTLIGAG
ncbi:MAG: hypothetical protein PUB93_04525 [Firmicutes bacterium]|nr:hypothetical protein [Bacillota bacterium]